MTTEERLLRLENAYITLSDLAAKADQRQDRTDERMEVLTQLAINTDERMEVLTQLALNFDSRMDRITETQARTEANLEALTMIAGEIGKKVDALAVTVDRYISEGRDG